MTRWMFSLALAVTIAVGLASAVTGQSPMRIFGTDSNGQAVAIGVTGNALLVTGAAPTNATYITQTANGTLTAEQALSTLATGIMQVTTTSGAITSVTTSAGVAGLLSDETGTGAMVFGTAPVFTTSATAGVIATQDVLKLLPNTSGTRFTGTLTPADLTADRSYTFPDAGGTVSVMSLTAHTAAGSTETVDWSLGAAHRIILDENLTLTLTNPIDGGRYAIVLVQDAGATNTVTWADDANIYWSDGGVAPVITATANAISLCTFIYDATLSKYLGACSLDHK